MPIPRGDLLKPLPPREALHRMLYVMREVELVFDIVYSILEIARINELRAMADMLQRQLEGSVHGPFL